MILVLFILFILGARADAKLIANGAYIDEFIEGFMMNELKNMNI